MESETIKGIPSASSRLPVIGRQISPRPWVAMKLMALGVAIWAGMMRSPSFSRSSSVSGFSFLEGFAMVMVNRKGFKFNMPISDKEIWGIGLVTYQWSLLEHTIDNWTNAATGQTLRRSAGQRASFNSPLTKSLFV